MPFPEVELADLIVPIDLCHSVPEDEVRPDSVTDLESRGFSQAVVCSYCVRAKHCG